MYRRYGRTPVAFFQNPSGIGSGTLFSEYRTFLASGTLPGSCAISAWMNCSARPCRHARSQSLVPTFGGCADAGSVSETTAPTTSAQRAGRIREPNTISISPEFFLENLARIQDAVRIHRLLDRAHQ